MTEDDRQPKLIHSILAEDEEIRLLELLDYLDERVPAEYRSELLAFLLPRTLPAGQDVRMSQRPVVSASDPGGLSGQRGTPEAGGAVRSPRAEEQPVPELESYRALFARRGDTLLKALATLRFAETKLEVRWLTPTEIVRLMGELDEAHKVYRPNVSNVLRKEKTLVARRPRGRGYEYGLTKPGRARVLREVSLLGVER